jgi:hypothetical protein
LSKAASSASFWSPRSDLDVRKLAAIEALSRYGKAQGRLLGSLTDRAQPVADQRVIDWINILRRVPDVPQREQRLQRPADPEARACPTRAPS